MTGNQNRFTISSRQVASQSNRRLEIRRSSFSGNSDRLALILSMVFHLSVACLIGWLVLSNLPEGASETNTRTGGIVLVDARTEVTEYLSEGDFETEESPEVEQLAAAASEAAKVEAPDLPGTVFDGQEGESDTVVESLPDIGRLDLSRTGAKDSGGNITTQVFGVSGTGSKFVYVFDRSDSMSGFEQRPIKAAQQELLKSLESLSESNQFQIVFYNKAVEVFAPDGYPRLYYADSDRLKEATRFVESIRPDGGTDHMKALESAFRFSPDVIFLLTDAEVQGGFSRGQLARIAGMNQSNAIINVVEFGSYRGADRSLQKVSEASGGEYVFKNVNSLKLEK